MNTLTEDIRLADELAALTGKPWTLTDTGGGCTALELITNKTKQTTRYFMVTHSEDASVPAADEPHTLGEYIDNKNDIWSFCEPMNLHYFANRAELIAHLNQPAPTPAEYTNLLINELHELQTQLDTLTTEIKKAAKTK